MKKSIKHMLRKWYVISGLVIFVVIVSYILLKGNKAPVFETATVTIGNVIEKVSVTGKVSPIEKAELSFEKGGTIVRINAKVGDRVKKGDVIAALDNSGDLAALAKAEAELADISRTLRPEEKLVEQSKVDSAKINLDNAKEEAGNAIRDGYTKAQSAVVNYADQMFSNPQTVNPTIKIQVDSSQKQSDINNSRTKVSDTLAIWKKDIDGFSAGTNIPEALSRVRGYISIVSSFMSDMSGIVNFLNPTKSGISQAVIDGYVSSMNAGQSILNQAITAVSAAETNFRNADSAYAEAQNNFLLKNAGSSAEVLRAKTASVSAYRAELAKDDVVSPIDGIVTRVDPSLGEFVSAGHSSFSVQSDGVFKIEANVPEADIAKIAIGNIADVTLDAYGSNVIFPAIVSNIDPAETVLEGVPTYKVTLQFANKDERIRSGMTANTDILTHERNNVLVVPSRAIVDLEDSSAIDTNIRVQTGRKAVRVLNPDGRSYRQVPVTTGLKGSLGTIEIIDGLLVGDKVVTYVK